MNNESLNQNYEFRVEGMSCASCVGRIERILKKVEGVVSAEANLATSKVLITSHQQIAVDEIAQKLTKAGYPATYLPAIDHQIYTLSVDEMTCASCVGRVERILNKIAGVSDAHVNLATASASFTTESNTDIEQIIQKLTKAGYPARRIKTESDSPELSNPKSVSEIDQLRRDLILALTLSIPVFVLEMGSHLIPALHHWIMHSIGHFNNWLIQFVLTTLVLMTAGRRFYIKGIPSLLRGAPDMNALVAVGTLAAYLYSVVVTFAPQFVPSQSVAVYYESAVVIITLILLGRFLEAKAKSKTSDAIQHLINLQPKTARVKCDSKLIDVPIKELQCNDIVIVKPGETIPIDGVIVEGTSHINESMMTGEPLPVSKTMNDHVIGGTLNQNGSLLVRLTAVGNQTVLSQIIRLVEKAQGSKLPIQTIIDQITLWFVPLIFVLSGLTFGIWYLFGAEPALSMALVNAVAVLIIACPCAMGLATPVSIMVATGRAAELGVLFKNGETLQTLKDIQVVAFDKTGTLTKGTPTLTDFIVLPHTAEDNTELLQLATSLEALSEHPISLALLEAAKQQNIKILPIESFQALAGLGVRGEYQGLKLYLGAKRFIEDQLGLSTDGFKQACLKLEEQGKTPFYFAINNDVKALLAVADELKPDTCLAIQKLQASGVHIAMISGDNLTTARHVAQQLNIQDVIADVLPDQKVKALESLRQKFGKIAFVGDGINDAPALASADVGIAIGTGTDIAVESADVILMSGQITGVMNALAISKATIRNIKQNLFWAFAYNFALIPIAMGILYPFTGILLSPMFAAGAMAMSSVFVISNALRLKRFKVD